MLIAVAPVTPTGVPIADVATPEEAVPRVRADELAALNEQETSKLIHISAGGVAAGLLGAALVTGNAAVH